MSEIKEEAQVSGGEVSGMSDLKELLERVEAAEGPDRELDGLIAKQFGELPSEAYWFTKDVYGDPHAEWVSGGYGAYKFYEPEEYTASIDAALALVEKVLSDPLFPRIAKVASLEWECHIGRANKAVGTLGRAATPSLAILAALLKAKIAEAESTSQPPKPEPQPSSQG